MRPSASAPERGRRSGRAASLHAAEAISALYGAPSKPAAPQTPILPAEVLSVDENVLFEGLLSLMRGSCLQVSVEGCRDCECPNWLMPSVPTLQDGLEG